VWRVTERPVTRSFGRGGFPTVGGFFDVYTLVPARTASAVERFLARFAPAREPSADEYEVPHYADPPPATFRTAAELVAHCAAHPTEPHAVYWRSLVAGDRPLAVGGQVVLNRLKAERFPINIESANSKWLNAYVRVFDHPYFAVTGPDGRFEIRYAPKGDLRLFVWQEAAGYRGGQEGRLGEAIKVPSGRLDLGDLKIKER
jgi:hypothetical protein